MLLVECDKIWLKKANNDNCPLVEAAEEIL